MIMLEYDREYRVKDNIAFEYEVGKRTVRDAIQWVEETLVKGGTFCLPAKRSLLQDASIDVVLVDATVCETERAWKSNESIISARKRNTQ